MILMKIIASLIKLYLGLKNLMKTIKNLFNIQLSQICLIII